MDQVFAWILEEVAEAGYLSSKAVFIDGTHIKANANTKKRVKAAIPAASKHYAKELMEEVNADREAEAKRVYWFCIFCSIKSNGSLFFNSNAFLSYKICGQCSAA